MITEREKRDNHKMKRPREEYVPTPEILDLIEHGVTSHVDHPVYQRPLVFEGDDDDEEDLLDQLAQILAQEKEEEEEETKKEPVLTKEEQRVKTLDDYYDNLVKTVPKKKATIEARVEKKIVIDPLTIIRIAENKEYNTSIPTILTMGEILIVILKYTSIESIIKLQRTTSTLYKLIGDALNQLNPLSISIVSDSALDHYFSIYTTGILDRMKVNAKSIRYIARDNTWEYDGEDKYVSSRVFVRHEKGLNIRIPFLSDRSTRSKPHTLTKIIVNIREANDISALFKYFKRMDVHLVVHYCPGRQVESPAIMCERVRHHILTCRRTVSSLNIIYDPYGHLFDAIDNEPAVSFPQ